MVWPEVVVEGAITQHVVSGGQDGSGDGADGLLGSPSIAQALKLGLQIAGLFLDAGPGTLHQGGFQPGRAFAHLVGAPLAGTLVVAGAEARPRDKVARGREAACLPLRRRGSMPISETITCAVRSLTPGMLHSRRTASRKGSRSWSTASSISAKATSRVSI